MSVWWGLEHAEQRPPRGAPALELVPAARAELARAVRERVPRFAPRWLGVGQDDDAGEALLRVFGDMSAAVARRINLLPDKAQRELLRAGGITPLLGTPATTLVQFQVSPAAPAPVFVGRGFRLGAPPAAGELDLVEFETTEDLYASPGTLQRVVVQNGAFREDVSADDPAKTSGFRPFDARPSRERSLWLGIASEVHPGRQLKFAVGIVPNAWPAPRGAGSRPGAVPALPLLGWEVLDGTRLRTATLIADETESLTRSGLLELGVAASWAKSKLGGEGTPLHWLRVRVLTGEYSEVPHVAYVLFNATRAAASVTLRNQVLEPIDGVEGSRFRLPKAPVVEGSLELVVDDPAAVLAGEPEATPWREIAELDDASESEPVYELDAAEGILTFGDGVHGKKLPVGFRHVRALRYRVAFGAESAIQANTLTTMLTSAPLLLSVKNPLPASGGQAAEPLEATLARGPLELRARGRAVAVADYGLVARMAEGAIVTRALGVSGRHPELPGVAVPGVVGVLVLGKEREDGPPLPSEQELAAVARHVQRFAPAGVEIIASAPRFHGVSAAVRLSLVAGADATRTVLSTIEALDRYFHPLHGGEDGRGWPFGAPIRHAALVRRLSAVPGVEAIVTLSVTLDGTRSASCDDTPLSAYGLLWPAAHEVLPLARTGTP
jgi:hypothetical protein